MSDPLKPIVGPHQRGLSREDYERHGGRAALDHDGDGRVTSSDARAVEPTSVVELYDVGRSAHRAGELDVALGAYSVADAFVARGTQVTGAVAERMTASLQNRARIALMRGEYATAVRLLEHLRVDAAGRLVDDEELHRLYGTAVVEWMATQAERGESGFRDVTVILGPELQVFAQSPAMEYLLRAHRSLEHAEQLLDANPVTLTDPNNRDAVAAYADWMERKSGVGHGLFQVAAGLRMYADLYYRAAVEPFFDEKAARRLADATAPEVGEQIRARMSTRNPEDLRQWSQGRIAPDAWVRAWDDWWGTIVGLRRPELVQSPSGPEPLEADPPESFQALYAPAVIRPKD